MTNTYEVDKFWEVSGLISNLGQAQKHEKLETIFLEIKVKPVFDDESGAVVKYQISTISLPLSEI